MYGYRARIGYTSPPLTTEVFPYEFYQIVPEGVTLRDTAVGGNPAYWIEGGPHVVYLFDDAGQLPGSERTVSRSAIIA